MFYQGLNGDKADPAGNARTVRVETKENTTAGSEPLDDVWLKGQVAERSDLDASGNELRREYYTYTNFRTANYPDLTAPNTGYEVTRDAFVIGQTVDKLRQTTALDTASPVEAGRKTITTTTYRPYTEPASGARPAIDVGKVATVVDGAATRPPPPTTGAPRPTTRSTTPSTPTRP